MTRRFPTGRNLRRIVVVTLLGVAGLFIASTAKAAMFDVLNTAQLQFQPGTNSVTNLVSSATLRVSVFVNDAPPPTIGFFRDAGFNSAINAATLGQSLYVRSLAEACNANPVGTDTNTITITSTLTGDTESFLASEQGTNSGAFVISPYVPTRNADQFPVTSGNGILETRVNDTLTATIDCGGTNRAAVNVLIQPAGGVVFDSRSNLPVEGARVTLIDAASGLPALVFQPDGSGQATNTVVTGPDGVYDFPFVNPGTYLLRILPPPGYSNPSRVPLNDLPSGRRIANPGSFAGLFEVTLANPLIQIDYPLDAVQNGGSGLFVQKVASRTVAEIGDFVDYTVRIRNISGAPLSSVRLVDQLPYSFAYRAKSARLEGAAIPDPVGTAGPRLTFPIGAIANDATVTLTYRVRIGVGAAQGDGINTAQAFDDGLPARVSNRAQARVRVEGGVFTDRAFIVGKVFVDANTNRIQDDGEVGVPGIRIFMEDGTYVITDSEGKYSFYGIRPRTHVLKVDSITLPPGAKLEELSTRDALSPSTRFVELRKAELHKADFAILPGPPEMMKDIEQRRKEAEKAAGELDSAYKSDLRREGELPVSTLDARNLPATGIIGARTAPGADPKATGLLGVAPNASQSRAGVSPAPSADLPGGTGSASAPTTAPTSPTNAPVIPSGESPDGTGGSPVPPATNSARDSTNGFPTSSANPAPTNTPPSPSLRSGEGRGATAPGAPNSGSARSTNLVQRAEQELGAPNTRPMTAAEESRARELLRQTPVPPPRTDPFHTTFDVVQGPLPAPASPRPSVTLTAENPSSTPDAIGGSGHPGRSNTEPAARPAVPLAGSETAQRGHFDPLLPFDSLTAANSDVPGQGPADARIKLQTLLTNLDNSLDFLDLRDGDTLPMPQATVRVKGVQGAKFGLTVNGVEVPASRIGKQAVLAEKQIEAWEFIGVSFRPGTNTLRLMQRDPFGNSRGEKTIRVIAPDKLGGIRLVLPKQDQPADGKTPAKIVILLEDARGVPVTARTPLTLETSLGEWMAQDLNKVDLGIQVFIEGGRVEIGLKPPLGPGDAKIRVSSGAMTAQATVPFLPDLRPMLAVGVVEGRLSLNSLKAGSIIPSRSQDGFEEELRSWSVSNGDDTRSAGARAAFYLKGKIKGEYLLTAAYDSDKDTKERLFRDIQPDEFYPIYGDSATKGYDAQSTGRLYVRIDKRKSYLLYGDFITATTSEARQLGNYNRSLTGIREHYEKNRLSLNAWASEDSTRQVIEEVRANGTSGPYFVGTANGIVNSEKVEIITRDRHQPSLVIKTEPLTRFADYEFEPFTGRILLRAPVPSLDANLNPIYVRVTYETQESGEKFWTYGGDAQLKVNKWWEVGGSGARDENPRGDYGLYSGNTTFKLAPKTFLMGEFAHSDAAGVGGDAARAELRHQGGGLDARIYYNWSEGSFSNAAAIISGGRVEAGAKISQKIGANTRLVAQAIDTEQSGAGGGSRRGVTAGVEHTFTNQMRLEVGGRYSTETAIPASPSTSAPNGVTPNDVASLRVKFTTPVPKVKGASVYGEYENDLQDTDRRMAAVGGEYQLKQKTRLYGRYEFIDSIGGPFELNNFQQQNTAVLGLDTEYMKDGRLFNEYRMRDAISGREAEAATGVRNLWNVAEGLRLSTSFEHVSPVIGDNHQNEATAVTGGIEYTRNPNWKGTARLELRTAEANDSLLNTLSYARKINRDWAFLGRQILYLVDNNGPTDGSRSQARWQAGFAWRQTTTDRWNALMRYEFKYETDSTQPALDTDRQVHILSTHVNFQPCADWVFSGHYGGKLAFDKSGGFDDVYDAHMVNLRATWEIHRRFDIGLNVCTLYGSQDDNLRYGIGPEIGFTVAKNLRLGVGYNFFGFNDSDLSPGEYTSHGVYVALRLKFDEALLNLGKKKEAGK